MGLPTLESFGAATSAQGSPKRMIAINQDLGFIPKLFFPKGEGRDYELSPYLQKIAAHREQFTVFSGLSHPGVKMKRVTLRKDLTPGSWFEEGGKTAVCFDIAKGKTEIHFG